MKHRILVLGAGYAGAFAAGSLARRLSPADTEVTVVNAEPVFVERMRLHQLAAGRDITPRRLTDLFAGTGVRLRVARVTAVDPERRIVSVTGEDGDGELGYDTLLYTLGSRVADHGVPGVAEHAFDVAGRPSALRLRDRLDRLDGRGGSGTVLVVGEGLTGIETATGIAESRPGLSVALAARGELGAWLSRGLGSTCARPSTGWVSPFTSTPASKPSGRRTRSVRTAPPSRPRRPCGRPGSPSTPSRPPPVSKSPRTDGSSSTTPCVRSCGASRPRPSACRSASFVCPPRRPPASRS